MEILGGPAALGGVIMCVALVGWAIGRWQGGSLPSFDDIAAKGADADSARTDTVPHATAAETSAPCQHAAQAERRVALDTATSIGEVHAEISAYRKAERVLSSIEGAALHYDLLPQTARDDCRYVGVMGQPTCGVPAAAQPAGGCASNCTVPALFAAVAAQPSAPVSDFTRV